MKYILISIPIFFLTLFVYTKVVGPIPFSVSQTTTNKTDLFTVTGTGKVSAIPDIAKVTVGIQAKGTTVKIAQDEMNRTINTVSDAIKKLGVDKKDIKTTNYNINPTYDYSNGKQTITGYNANTNLEITIRNLEQANTVIDVSTANGANTVGNVSFDVEDKTKAQNDARKLAIEEAKKKATDASSVAGFRLGSIINYQESFNGGTQPRAYLMATKSNDTVSAPTELESGSEEIQVTVTLSYEIQ